MSRLNDPVYVHAKKVRLSRDGAFQKVVIELQEGVRQSLKEAKHFQEADGGPYDGLVDASRRAADQYLGAAFVVCQGEITRVSVAAVALGKRYNEEKCRPAPTWLAGRAEVRATGEKVHTTNVSECEFIWALGNYFKHKSEWGNTPWAGLTGQAARTAATLTTCGISNGDDVLLKGLEILTGCSTPNLVKLADLVCNWSGSVAEQCDALAKEE